MEFAARKKFGPRPAYEGVDVARALWFLRSGRMGRKELSKKLCLGEGTTRSILSVLDALKALDTNNQGVELTKKGQTLLHEVFENVREVKETAGGELTFNQLALAMVLRSRGSLNKGLEQRDAAIRFGASGLTILVREKNAFVFPDSGDTLCAELGVEASEGNLVLLCYAEDELGRQRGAWAAALSLFH